MTEFPPAGGPAHSPPRTKTEDPHDLVRTAIATADGLEAQGRWREAIDLLSSANAQARHSAFERRLVRLRHDAFEYLDRSYSPPWPPDVGVGGTPAGSPPEVSFGDLDHSVLISSILSAGCLLVRGLIPPPAVERLVGGIERAYTERDLAECGRQEDRETPWFKEFNPAPKYERAIPRGFLRNVVLAADSPPMLFDLLEIVGDARVPDLVADYLGERPALSVTKTTLRRVSKDSGAQWHQDGAFMGTDVRTLNLWLSLSDCGDDAPGLDILPCRLDDIVKTGTEGAIFDWSASPAMVERAGRGTKIRRPIFRPGDALLFDHMFMHSTATSPEMTGLRYAVEMWFFAPSLYPAQQVPLVV